MNAAVPHDPVADPYDPNDAQAVQAYWNAATIRRGPGWQTRIDAVLRKAGQGGLTQGTHPG